MMHIVVLFVTFDIFDVHQINKEKGGVEKRFPISHKEEQTS